jgi:hypothetical protein
MFNCSRPGTLIQVKEPGSKHEIYLGDGIHASPGLSVCANLTKLEANFPGISFRRVVHPLRPSNKSAGTLRSLERTGWRVHHAL